MAYKSSDEYEHIIIHFNSSKETVKMNRIFMTVCLVVALVAAVSSNAVPIAAASLDYPRYAYNYAVNDPLTRDNKAQWEIRDGGAVKGSYSLVEPDGSLRIVDYAANDLTGFNAIVKKIGPGLHPSPLITKIPLTPITKLPLINPIGPLNYGFGPAPLAIGLPKSAALGHWSLPWDPFTASYGGWVPIGGHLPLGPYATIYSKKFDSKGRLVRAQVTGPIPIGGKKLIIRKRHG